MAQEKDRSQRESRESQQARKDAKPSVPRGAVPDLEPREEQADAIKGGRMKKL